MNDVTMPGLIVPVEARITQLERGLAKANRAQRRAAERMERRAAQSATKIGASYGRMSSGIASAFGKMALPLAGGIASSMTARAISETTKRVAELGDEAKRSGLSLETFQEWKFVAEQNRIGVDQMIDGIKELNLRADEFVTTGGGSAAEAFARLGIGAESLREKLADPSELMLEIVRRLQRLDRAARIRIADEVFGGSGGERFVELIDQGEDGLRRTMNRAHEVGAVLAEDVVTRASELDRKFGEIQTRVSNLAKRGIVSLVGALDDVAEAVDRIGEATSNSASLPGTEDFTGGLTLEQRDALEEAPDLVDEHRDALVRASAEYGNLKTEISAAAREMLEASVQLNQDGFFELAEDAAAFSRELTRLVSEYEKGEISAQDFGDEVGDVMDEAKSLIGELGTIDAARFGNVIRAIAGIGTALATVRDRVREVMQAIPALREATEAANAGPGMTPAPETPPEFTLPPTDRAPRSSPRPRAAPPMTHELVSEPSRGGGGGARRDEYAREVEAIREEVVALNLEAAALVATAAAGKDYAGAIESARKEAELLHAAQRQGRAVTPALRAEIAQLAEVYGDAAQAAQDAEDRLDQLAEAKTAVKETARDAFTDLVTGARDLDDALANVLSRLAEMAANRAFEEIWAGVSGGTGAPASGGGGGSTGGNWLAALASAFLGFERGGFTGAGNRHEVAGVVHRGEYVLPQEAVKRIGVDTLAGLHSAALKGYSGGGLVGGAVSVKPRSATRTESLVASGQPITVNAPVTVNASGGSLEQNTDLAKRISKEMEANMRGVVVDELRRQSRPGNMLSSRRT